MAEPRFLVLSEPRSGLSARLWLLDERAPVTCALLWAHLARPRRLEALHAMYTGPELSFPLDGRAARAALGDRPLPLENATAFPAAGDLLLTHLPARLWAGSPEEVFDLGLFYAPGGRTLLPVGLLPGSLCARVEAADLADAAAACQRVRRLGAVTVELSREADCAP